MGKDLAEKGKGAGVTLVSVRLDTVSEPEPLPSLEIRRALLQGRAGPRWHAFSTEAWGWVARIAVSRGRSSRCLEQGEGFPFWVPRRPEAS